MTQPGSAAVVWLCACPSLSHLQYGNIPEWSCSTNVREVLENDPSAYYVHDELLAPLKAMYASLTETGDDSIANGRLLDVMRQVCMFPPCNCLPFVGQYPSLLAHLAAHAIHVIFATAHTVLLCVAQTCVGMFPLA